MIAGVLFRSLIVGLVVSILRPAHGQGLWPPARPGNSGAYHAEVSFTARGDLEGQGSAAGSVETTVARAGYTHTFSVSSRYAWSLGLGGDSLFLRAPDAASLPDDLYGISLRLSSQWEFAQDWALRVDVRPGIYSDLGDVSWRDGNVPFLVAAGYRFNTNLVVLAGINVNLWSRLATVGGPGLWWRFADDWRLNLVLPRPSLEYVPSAELSLYILGEIAGSGYRLADDYGTARGDPALNGDILGYREIRAGGGIKWTVQRWLELRLEAGHTLDRELEFREADRELSVADAPYVEFRLSGRF